MLQFFIWGLAAVIFSGCSFQKPMPTMSYGEAPSDYESQITEYFQRTLKDPDSAKYKFGTPRRAYVNAPLAYGGEVTWVGYAVPVQVNAKNGFGGYAGFQPFTFLFQNGSIREYREGWNPLLVTFID